MQEIILTLGWPPSLNTYWRHLTRGKLAGRTLLSEKGRAYQIAVIAAVKAQLPEGQWAGDGRLSVEIVARPPDRRARDLDNLPKAILDGLTHARVWVDDSQIDRLLIERAERVKGGSVQIKIVDMRNTAKP